MRNAVPIASYRDLLSRYLRPHAPAALALGACLLLSTGLALAAPAIAGAFIDAAIAKVPLAALGRLAALFLLTALFAQAAALGATVIGERVAWQATNALRLDLARHLLSLDRAFHARHLPGELIERVDGDVSSLASLLSAVAADLLGSALLLLGLVAALWRLDGLLALSFGGFVALTAALLEFVRRRAVPLQQRSRSRGADFYGLAGEVLEATEDLRANGGGAYALSRLRAGLLAWLPTYVRAEVAGYGVWIAALCAFGVADGIAYGFGAQLYLARALPLGSVYTIVAYAALVARPLGTLRERLAELQGADAGILRIQALLSERPALRDGEGLLPGGPLDVAFDGVRFAYPGRDPSNAGQLPALSDISFRLAAGRRLGVLGRSGAGKSTLARLLMRLLDAQEGRVLVGGQDVRRLRISDLRERVAYVTQEVQIFRASLKDNITLFDPAARDASLREQLQALGLGPWLARQPQGLETQISGASLSAGEAQLIALLRAFQKEPGVVVLDEVTSRLDPETEQLLEHALELLLAGRTAIVIAHRVQTLRSMDDILVLDGGRVAEHGARKALERAEGSRYARLRASGFLEVLD